VRQKKLQKYGIKRGKQRYLCCHCKYQFSVSHRTPHWIKKAYDDYVIGKQTLEQLSRKYQRSLGTLRKHFDQFCVPKQNKMTPDESVNLVFDATFFSRSDGVLVFRANRKNLYWRFIKSETIKEIDDCLLTLVMLGHEFKSFTIDGRKGVISLLKQRFPSTPIQLCHFHQVQTIRRYTTNNPKTACGKELKVLMLNLTDHDELSFTEALQQLHSRYDDFLKERNDNKQFVHRRLRSAFRSLRTNLPHLFTHKKFPELNIPNTTNTCDGSFAHWKQKVKIHRGLRKHRRNKMINFLLNFNTKTT